MLWLSPRTWPTLHTTAANNSPLAEERKGLWVTVGSQKLSHHGLSTLRWPVLCCGWLAGKGHEQMGLSFPVHSTLKGHLPRQWLQAWCPWGSRLMLSKEREEIDVSAWKARNSPRRTGGPEDNGWWFRAGRGGASRDGGAVGREGR